MTRRDESSDPLVIRRPGRAPIAEGDLVRVTGSHLELGWKAVLVRWEQGGEIAVVTPRTTAHGPKCGVRTVAADRVIRRYR